MTSRRRPRRIRLVRRRHHERIAARSRAGVFRLPAGASSAGASDAARLAREDRRARHPRGHHRRHPRARILRDGGRGGVRVVLHLIVIHHEIVVARVGRRPRPRARLVVAASPLRPPRRPARDLFERGRHRTPSPPRDAWDDATDEKTRDRPRTRAASRCSRTATRAQRGFLERDFDTPPTSARAPRSPRRRRRKHPRRVPRVPASFGFTRGLARASTSARRRRGRGSAPRARGARRKRRWLRGWRPRGRRRVRALIATRRRRSRHRVNVRSLSTTRALSVCRRVYGRSRDPLLVRNPRRGRRRDARLDGGTPPGELGDVHNLGPGCSIGR